jgi:hypothetical protein
MSIDDDIDRLYQVPPAQFVAERNALAKRAGARAAEIRALPKPTLPVWAVNQLHWQRPDVYRALVDAAGNLRATHKAVLAGKRGDLRAASRVHEEALDAALKATLAIAAQDGTPPSDAARQAIGTTLRALPAGDPPGRLREALKPGGFEMLAGLPAGGRVVPAPAPSARAGARASGAKSARGETAPARKIDKAALARAQKAADAAARALTAAEQAARREEFEAARAVRELEKAQRRVARAREALAEAESELREAENEAAAAEKTRDAAQDRAESADRTLETARSRAETAREERAGG